MVRSRLGLKALGLSVLVLGLMAFATGGVAQAETGAEWVYEANGKLLAISESLLPTLSAKLTSANAALDFTTGGGTKVEIQCTAFAINGSPKLLLNGSIGNGTATFTNCETFLNGKLSSACLPKTAGATKTDEVTTNVVHGLLMLHTLPNGTKHHVVLLLPLETDKEGKPLAATLEMGEECSIGEKVPVTGHLVVWDELTGLKHLTSHPIKEFVGLPLLRALNQPATVLGTASAFLTEGHSALAWAGLTLN
jgi:hypothetical protein